MKLEIRQKIFEKSSNTKYHENPSIGNRVVPCGRTDMTKLTAAFRSFANAPKNNSNGTQQSTNLVNISIHDILEFRRLLQFVFRGRTCKFLEERKAGRYDVCFRADLRGVNDPFEMLGCYAV